jgi:hypothetical protein
MRLWVPDPRTAAKQRNNSYEEKEQISNSTPLTWPACVARPAKNRSHPIMTCALASDGHEAHMIERKERKQAQTDCAHLPVEEHL